MKLTDNDLFQVGVKALIKNGRGEILLLHDNPSPDRDPGLPIYWDLPGGRINNNHSTEETLRREVEEETGIKNIQIGSLLIASATNFIVKVEELPLRLMILVYQCQVIEPFSVVLSEEHQDFKWFSPQEAAEKLNIKYPQAFTDKIRQLV